MIRKTMYASLKPYVTRDGSVIRAPETEKRS